MSGRLEHHRAAPVVVEERAPVVSETVVVQRPVVVERPSRLACHFDGANACGSEHGGILGYRLRGVQVLVPGTPKAKARPCTTHHWGLDDDLRRAVSGAWWFRSGCEISVLEELLILGYTWSYLVIRRHCRVGNEGDSRLSTTFLLTSLDLS